jgi:hypothetical protein
MGMAPSPAASPFLGLVCLVAAASALITVIHGQPGSAGNKSIAAAS